MTYTQAFYQLVLVFLFIFILSRAFRRQIWRMCKWRPPTRTAHIRRRRFFWISCGYSILEVLAIHLVLVGLFIFEWLSGEMGGWQFLVATAIVTVPLGCLMYFIWHITPQPPYALFARHGIDIERALADARMAKSADGTWLYVDRNWYIAIRPGVACVFYAPLIDHMQPITSSFHRIIMPRPANANYTMLSYVTRDGTRVKTRFADVNGQMTRWFKIYGMKLR